MTDVHRLAIFSRSVSPHTTWEGKLDNNNNNQAVTYSAPKDGQTFLSIPCGEADFASFISGLLGVPQEITRAFRGTFSVELSDIENFYHLIEQSIKEQQHADLVQFQSTIIYNDGSSVKIGSINALREYAEVRAIVSTGVVLSFVYLITFPNKTIPEKQQIDIELRVKNSLSGNDDGDVIDEVIDPAPIMVRGGRVIYLKNSTGIVVVRIQHTARSWGADMENTIKDHVHNFMHKERSRIRSIMKSWPFSVGLVSFLLLFSFFCGLGGKITSFLAKYVRTEFYNLPNNFNTSDISALTWKIDAIANFIMFGSAIKIDAIMAIYYIFAIIVSIISSIVISTYSSTPKPSFILLSRKSHAEKTDIMDKYNSNLSKSVALFIINAMAGVLGNIIFFYIW